MRVLLVLVALGLGQAKVRKRDEHFWEVTYAAARWRSIKLLVDLCGEK